MKKQFLLTLAFYSLTNIAIAAPSGKIGFIGAKGAQVWNLRSGKVITISRSLKADKVTLSPQGLAVLTVPNGKKSKTDEDISDVFLSAPPYSRLTSVPKLQGVAPYEFKWSPSGNSLYLDAYDLHRVFTPQTGNVKTMSFSPQGFDAKGRLLGYSTENEVIIRDVKTGKNRVLFTIKKPKPLYDALRRAKYPKGVKELLDGESMQKESWAQWQLAGPAISPDGQRAYFASNAGTGYGAAGNGMQGYFAVDLRTGVISVLSSIGADFGRPPEMTISPDGKRLLSIISVHDSAADNSSYATIIDLETQKMREIMFKIPGSKDRANWYGGSAWSPDGKYVAVSAHFYKAEEAMADLEKNHDWETPPASAWKTAIFEAATGKLWGVKSGMKSPSWSR